MDGDQIVLSQESRQQRSVSLATRQLEEQIKAHHMIKLKRAETEGNTEDVEYYKALITDLDALIGEEEQTPAPGRRFKLAAPEEGTLVAKVLKNELKKIAFSSVLFCESPGLIRYRFTDQLLRVAIRLKVVRGIWTACSGDATRH